MNTKIRTEVIETAPPGVPDFPDDTPQAASYRKRLPEIRAVSPDTLVAINLDVQQAVTTILGALLEIEALRDEVAKLVHVDHSLIDGLGEYAEAAAEANSRYTIAVQPPEDIVALYEEALHVRETFRLDAHALANRGFIPAENLKAFKGVPGYRNVAFEIIDYANLLMSCWQSIEGKSGLTVDEVLKAKQLGSRLRLAVGHREQAPEMLAEVSLIRQQALTLLLKAYDEVRRALSYLRWKEGDVETIAPSLYAGRGKRKPHEESATPGQTTPAAPPATTAPALATTSVDALRASEPVEDGFPGGSPLRRS